MIEKPHSDPCNFGHPSIWEKEKGGRSSYRESEKVRIRLLWSPAVRLGQDQRVRYGLGSIQRRWYVPRSWRTSRHPHQQLPWISNPDRNTFSGWIHDGSLPF